MFSIAFFTAFIRTSMEVLLAAVVCAFFRISFEFFMNAYIYLNYYLFFPIMLQEDALSGLSVQWFPQPEVSSKNMSVICKLGFLCYLYGYHQKYFLFSLELFARSSSPYFYALCNRNRKCFSIHDSNFQKMTDK